MEVDVEQNFVRDVQMCFLVDDFFLKGSSYLVEIVCGLRYFSVKLDRTEEDDCFFTVLEFDYGIDVVGKEEFRAGAMCVHMKDFLHVDVQPFVDRFAGRINLGFEYKRRQTSPVKLVTEDYFNITLGINFNEMWFWQNKDVICELGVGGARSGNTTSDNTAG